MPIPRLVAIAIEAALVGVACALAAQDTIQVLAALTFPPFTAGLRRGTRGALASWSVELGALATGRRRRLRRGHARSPAPPP